MKRFVWMILTLAIVAGFSTSQVFARGGGHGGGHHGGGHHASHHSGRHAHHGQHTHHHYAHHGAHRPFTHGWHGNHAGAWGWGRGGYGWGNPWAAATLGTAAGWLGASALEDDGYPIEDNTVYTSDNSPEDYNSQDSQQTADNEQEPQTFEPAFSSEQAGQLAAGGVNEPADGNYLPLGVYTFAPLNEGEASAMLHLAVSKEGVLRGSYFDLRSDKDQHVQGSVDKKTGVVAFTVGQDNKVVFQTTLRDLTSQSGPVAVHEADGKTVEWTIAKADENQSENKTGDHSNSSGEAQPSAQPSNQK